MFVVKIGQDVIEDISGLDVHITYGAAGCFEIEKIIDSDTGSPVTSSLFDMLLENMDFLEYIDAELKNLVKCVV
jgi:hypothetical protein